MFIKALEKGIYGFSIAVAINTIIFCFMGLFGGQVFFVPEFGARFKDPATAVVVELIMIGFSSASLSAGTVIMELERLSLVVQSLLYFLVTLVVWVGVGCYCWGMNKYPQAFIVVLTSYTFSYILCWIIQYRICNRQVREINERLTELAVEE